MINTSPSRKTGVKNTWIFLAFWAITFLVYIPACKSGWVIDAAGWIHDMKSNKFWDFLNRTHSSSQSFYQLFALHYFVFYKIWGLNQCMWSLLYITVNSANAYLLYTLCKNLFDDSSIKNGKMIALAGAALFCVCPHISEVVIWKACSHYLQGFAFLLLTMLWVQKFQHTQQPKYAWYAAIILLLSVFGLEIFYLIPFFTLIITLYYRIGLGYNKKVFAKTLKFFFIPQLLILCAYFIALYAAYKFLRPHKTEINESLADYLSKPIKYLYHILFLGRYFSMDVKTRVYNLGESLPVLIVFYALIVSSFIYSVLKLNDLKNNTKVILLLFICGMLSIFFMMPLPFPGPELLVFYDRYIYFSAGFVYVLIALLASTFIRNKYVLIGLFCLYVDLNVFFTIKVNTYWIDSNKITNKLIRNLPEYGNKTVLLLNIPENMNGVPMIGAQREHIFKALSEIYLDTSINGTIYDVASYNMVTDYNGAHVKVINDTVISVMLNHTGTWWWYEGHGAKIYETPDYKVDVKSVGQRYDLILKKPSEKYLLLYSVGDTWKKVDMSKINVQQD